MELVRISRELARQVDELRFDEPVTHVYNPLAYAWAPHERYLRLYGSGKKQVVLLGMNPGPFGMAQTGVPFGDVASVRDWLKVSGPVSEPPRPHPKRPVQGFACRRSEVSGTRLWGWARDYFGTPERFFADYFVVNYCPLAFMESSGRNRTPDKLPPEERRPLFEVCDAALGAMVRVLEPEFVIGVGAFAEQRARAALGGTAVRIGCMLHPSPASPRANSGWAALAHADLAKHGVRSLGSAPA